MKLRAFFFTLSFMIVNTNVLASDDILKTVDNARWQIQQPIDSRMLLQEENDPNLVSLFFVRPLDDDAIESSANLSLNNRYQVSLQPGNFTQLYSCEGLNYISAVVTQEKINDLSRNAQRFNLNAGQQYFFMIDVDSMNNTTISQIDQAQALEMMTENALQSHQISRVQPTCTTQKSIELKVLFDNDEFYVDPQYYPEIEQVAVFMATSPNVSVIIEGHTDSNASDAHNQRLSQNRAEAIRNILIQQFGVDSNKVQAIGYGESDPIASNSTAEGRQQNRRVVAVFSDH